MSDTPKLHIRSAKDLFGAIRSLDIGTRLSVLRAIAEHPEKAAAYGSHNGCDLIEELITQFYQSDEQYGTALLCALRGFRDGRVADLFKSQLKLSRGAEIAMLLAGYLSAEYPEESRPVFSELLLQDGSVLHARVAANAMSCLGDLSDRERIRVSILSAVEHDSPPVLDENTADLWLKELDGPHRAAARALIESQGEPAFRYLKGKYAALPEEMKEWLLRWGVRGHPARTVDLIIDALETGSDDLRLASLECIGAMGDAAVLLRPMVEHFLHHPEKVFRLAAINAGVSEDWGRAVFREKEADVRIRIMGRLTREKGVDAVPVLIELLQDRDYRVRAAATANLIRLGEKAVNEVRPLLDHQDEGVRIAATQVMLADGEERFLEEKFCL